MSHEVKKVISDNINIGNGPDLFIVRIEATQVNYNVTTQNGGVSTTQLLWNNVNLPSLSNSVIAKLGRIRYDVTISGSALPPMYPTTGKLSYVGPTMCLADFPLSRCTDALQVTINSQTTSINLRQTLGLLKRKFPREFLECYATECPTLADNAPAIPSEVLIGVTSAGANPQPVTFTGFPISGQPLSNYFNSYCGVSRTSFQPYASTATSLTYQIVEPILASPFGLSDLEVPFTNFNTLSVQYNMSALGQMCTMANGANYPAGYNVTLVNNAYIELVVSSVDNTLVSIPRTITTEYENVLSFPTTFTVANLAGGGTVAGIAISAGTTTSVTSQTLRLSNMPDVILIGARVQETFKAQFAVAGSASYTDAYLQWGKAAGLAPSQAGYSLSAGNGQSAISIQLNNRSGIMSSASVAELWRLSKKNGSNQSWEEFNTCGGILILRPSDLGISLDQGDLPVGLSGNVNFSATCTFNNSNYINNVNQLGLTDWTLANPPPMELVVVCVFKGVAYITPDSMNVSTSYLTAAEVTQILRSTEEPLIPASALMNPSEIQGKGLFGSAKNIIHSTASAVQSISKDPFFQEAVERVRKATGGKLKARGGFVSNA